MKRIFGGLTRHLPIGSSMEDDHSDSAARTSPSGHKSPAPEIITSETQNGKSARSGISKMKSLFRGVQGGESTPMSRDLSRASHSSQAVFFTMMPKARSVKVGNLKSDTLENMSTAILERLVEIIESGRGGARALTEKRFEDSMEKLITFYIDLQDGGALNSGASFLDRSPGFDRPPSGLINQNRDSGTSMLKFMRPYLERDIDSENFCLQNLISDLTEWTMVAIKKQEAKIGKAKSEHLLGRISKAKNIEFDTAEFSKNPISRPPETQEEALQFIYFSSSLYANEDDWRKYARDIYAEIYPAIEKISFMRAKEVYRKNRSNGVYGD